MFEKKIVKNYIDADKLIKEGFLCRGIDRNVKNKTELIFWFDNTKELRKRLSEMLREK